MSQEPVRLKYGYLSAEPDAPNHDRQLDLKVIFTDLPKTAAALATARTMARGLSAHITLMAAEVVPYPLPLAAPDVPVEFTERMLKSIAVEDTAVEIYLCRDRNETIRRALPPDSVVIVGTRKWRWLPSWERQLTRLLRQDGRRVLVVTV
ncbi:MAG: hypothetical protein LAO55_15005 [Acidobacteriia bacterium]|nr:hypothetical protein [Terriglobia bacterium]